VYQNCIHMSEWAVISPSEAKDTTDNTLKHIERKKREH
jgi:hypothetical protein